MKHSPLVFPLILSLSISLSLCPLLNHSSLKPHKNNIGFYTLATPFLPLTSTNMECSDKTTFITLTSSSHSSSSSASPRSTPPSSPPPGIVTPCAACKILRRRCVDKCVLEPYFPPTEPLKFTIAHRVFGASNIIKSLQELPEDRRADAVNSMVYEANARIRDPVYGCAGAICQLQKQINELQAELAKAQAEILNVKCQNANLVELICMKMSQDKENNLSISPNHNGQQAYGNTSIFFEDSSAYAAWEPLWT